MLHIGHQFVSCLCIVFHWNMFNGSSSIIIFFMGKKRWRKILSDFFFAHYPIGYNVIFYGQATLSIFLRFNKSKEIFNTRDMICLSIYYGLSEFLVSIYLEKNLFFVMNCNQKYSLYTIENPLDGKNSL
jgi:hypothetical protein